MTSFGNQKPWRSFRVRIITGNAVDLAQVLVVPGTPHFRVWRRSFRADLVGRVAPMKVRVGNGSFGHSARLHNAETPFV
jgi:hypothetical protein